MMMILMMHPMGSQLKDCLDSLQGGLMIETSLLTGTQAGVVPPQMAGDSLVGTDTQALVGFNLMTGGMIPVHINLEMVPKVGGNIHLGIGHLRGEEATVETGLTPVIGIPIIGLGTLPEIPNTENAIAVHIIQKE